MNNNLIALAVAGACVAPAAMAQTANPVTLYGRVHATFEVVEATGGASGTPELVRRNRVSDQASLLGVRGTEDLGGGLNAFFQLETSFKPDENNSTFAARNSGVGLQGRWGSVLMGRWDTPFKVVTGAIDPFGDVTLGGLSAAMQGRGLIGASASNQFDRRDQNVIQYWSPAWAGIAVRASYSVNEGRTTGPTGINPQRWSGSITYTAGPIYVGYAQDEMKDNPYTTAAILKKQEGSALFGSFVFGPVKVGALYEEFKRTGYSKQKSWMGNVVWTMGHNQLIYQYQQSKDGQLSGSALGQPQCDVNSIGWQYNFSRRTFFLAQYTKTENNEEAGCGFGSNDPTGPSIVKGQDPKGISLGLRHIF